jgi:hypothetical protein
MTRSTAASSRRRFLRQVGLGIGAGVLGPVLDGLVAEAQGQPLGRKRALFVVTGNGLRGDNFTPKGVSDVPSSGVSGFAWPAMLKALEPHRSRMLLIDGLANQTRNIYGHTGGFGALSCVEPLGRGAEAGGPPGGPTIDQVIAAHVGARTRLRSVLYGITQNPRGPTLANVFGSGANKPEPHILSPRLLFNRVFEGIGADAALDVAPLKRRVVMDALREDLRRAQAALAGAERQKLDDYLSVIEEMEGRRAAMATAQASCRPAALTSDSKEDWKYGAQRPCEDILTEMHEMGTAALACGITNVVGVSFGTGHSHNFFPRLYKLATLVPREYWDGKSNYIDGALHNNAHQFHQMNVIHNFNAGLIARTIEVLSRIKEGDGTAWDNTVFVYLSENGDAHHAERRRWPIVVGGIAGGKLKADGRFLKYPRKPARGYRSLADLYVTLATALGVPATGFGKGGLEPTQGPLSELLA